MGIKIERLSPECVRVIFPYSGHMEVLTNNELAELELAAGDFRRISKQLKEEKKRSAT